MNRTDAIAFLTRCADDNGTHWYQGRPWTDVDTCPTCHGSNDAGHLTAPCSRYGRTAADIAPFVWRVCKAEQDTSESMLDHVMSMCVNDSETPQHWMNQYTQALSGADVDGMVAGYLECQLWAGLDYDHDKCHEGDSCDDNRDHPEPHPWDEHYSVADVDQDYVESLREEFAALVTEHPLAVRMFLNHREWYHGGENGQIVRKRRTEPSFDSGQFGHDFYLTREGHGAGFWDRGLGELGDYLTDIAKYAGSASDLYDNGNGVLVA